jgi:hypothetical protein
MADVASKQQTTALFLSTIVTGTRRHTELTKKLTNRMGNPCCAREHSVQFFVQFFLHSFSAQFNLECVEPLMGCILYFVHAPLNNYSKTCIRNFSHVRSQE